jgi:anti-sigma regulatory factor (Ser/Thr protein kinase)
MYVNGHCHTVVAVSLDRDSAPVADAPLTAEFDLPLSKEAAALARRTVTGLLRTWGVVDQDFRYDVLLITSELVTNAVRHGGRRVHLRLTLESSQLTLTVSDGSAVLPVLRDHDAGESGRGMAIIAAVAAQWGVRDRQDGKAVWATLTVPSVPAQRHAPERPDSAMVPRAGLGGRVTRARTQSACR